MNKKLNILLFAGCLLTACIEDEGNYDYTPIKDVAIEGLADSYRFVLQVPQALTPDISTSIDEANLSYCWRLGSDTLCRTKTFDYTFTKVPASSDPLTFDVWDSSTDIRYSKVMEINVVSPFYSGWLMLTEDDKNNGALAFQSYEDKQELFQDVYKDVNGEQMQGTPINVKQYRWQDGFTGAYVDRVTVVCGNGGKSFDLDGTSMERVKYYEDEFRDLTPNISNVVSQYYGYDMAINIVSDGKIYAKASSSMGSPEDAYYQYPLEGDDKGYSASSILGKGYDKYYFTLDEKNHRFVYYTCNSLSSVVSPVIWNESSSTAGVDLENVPGHLVWMDGELYSPLYSIVENNGKYTLRRFSISWDGTTTLNGYLELPDGTADGNSAFALNMQSPYLFVSVGNKLQAINLENLSAGADAVNNICTYEGNITSMFYAYNSNLGVNEFALTIDAGNGESSLLIVDPILTKHGEIVKRYDHVKGKVVSLWRKSM